MLVSIFAERSSDILDSVRHLDDGDRFTRWLVRAQLKLSAGAVVGVDLAPTEMVMAKKDGKIIFPDSRYTEWRYTGACVFSDQQSCVDYYKKVISLSIENLEAQLDAKTARVRAAEKRLASKKPGTDELIKAKADVVKENARVLIAQHNINVAHEILNRA